MRRRFALTLMLLATVAGCSQSDYARNASGSGGQGANAAEEVLADSQSAIPPEQTSSQEQAGTPTGPDLDPVSTPGVAFDYSYAFRLEANRIAGVQQEHQRLCARYGARCRITGVDYRAANEEDVEAMLSFAVAPEIAAQFGREGVGAVTAADGTLADNAVRGTEVGTSLKDNSRSREALEAELARVEARLAQRGIGRRERARLGDERRELRRQLEGLRESAEGQERQLAETPILFRYGSGAFAPGPAPAPNVGEAAERAADTFLGGLNIVAVVFVTLSPWILLALLIWGAIRLARRRLARPGTDAA
jgi:Domain of unknown function (DUF4349)